VSLLIGGALGVAHGWLTKALRGARVNVATAAGTRQERRIASLPQPQPNGAYHDLHGRQLSRGSSMQIGLEHHFAVAGDYNLALLDELLKNPSMQQVYCSNELNYGFQRRGLRACTRRCRCRRHVQRGALSAFNAIGGAYAENLPVIPDIRGTQHQ
jgi:hypothetical protein